MEPAGRIREVDAANDVTRALPASHEGRLANLIEGFGVNSRANNDEGDDGHIGAPNQR